MKIFFKKGITIQKETPKMSEENATLLQKLEELNMKINEIQITLENETNHNIALIAKKQCDLSRKLAKA